MPYKLNILPKADEDYYDSLNWYAAQQTDLPEKFAAAIRSTFDIILQTPEIFPKNNRGYRQVPTEKFPYLIVYDIDQQAGIISILSIFHTSRHPKKKLKK